MRANALLLLILTFAVGFVACSTDASQHAAHDASTNAPTPQASGSPADQSTSHGAHSPAAEPAQTATGKRIPAHFNYPPPLSSLAPTLDPTSFEDPRVRAAYQAAREIPQTLAQLPCFCYCDEPPFSHKSLHSCYEGDHSVGCGTCQDEALMAREFKKEGLSDEEIRNRIIATFGQ
jgi:hypothetical protein